MGILFDAGDGVSSGLLQKARKIKHVFISHADRDHLTGLIQLNQLNARDGFPVIYFPKDCGSFPAMETFTKNFDPHVAGTNWQAIVSGSEFQIKNDILVESVRNEHVPAASNISKSLGYKVHQTKRKLKPEFLKLSGNEIRDIIEKHGKEYTTEVVKTNILSFFG